MDRKILQEALRLTEAHRSYVLATVVDHQGSVPGKRGATLLVREDGSTVGTVGGAGLEEEVKFLARQAIRRGESSLYRFDLRAWQPGGLESLCGGSVDVSVQFVAARPNVLLWGGGHVALALSRQFALLDYDFSVADDRAEFVSAERFPQAKHRWTTSPEELGARWRESGENFSHVYLLGYSAKKDEEAAFHLLPIFPGRVGLIASRVKRERIRKDLAARGLAPETLSRLRSPVGVPMGAQTPEEIAVSITGEIIQDLHPSRSVPEPEEAQAEEAAKGRGEAGTGQA
jgi:xanthine dehydrogenase accessory factor